MNKTRYFYYILLLLIICTIFLYFINKSRLLPISAVQLKEGMSPETCPPNPTSASPSSIQVNNAAIEAAITSLQTQLSNLTNSPNSSNSIWPLQFIIDITTTSLPYITVNGANVNLPTIIIQNTQSADGTPSNTLPYIYLTIVCQSPPQGEPGPMGETGSTGPSGDKGPDGSTGLNGWWKSITG